MISCCLMLIMFWLIRPTVPALVGECSVVPTSVVVTVGERVNLTCAAEGTGSITAWDIKIDKVESRPIYKVPTSKQNGSLADGYFVTHPADNVTILRTNKTNISQAGVYVCHCILGYTDSTTVVVLDSEPTLTTNHTGAEGVPVAFSCFISFNESSQVSCELVIEDASGFNVTRICKSTVHQRLIVCKLEHIVIANASADQWHTCNVTLRTQDDLGDDLGVRVIYSKMLNATIEWPKEPHDKRDGKTHGLEIGMSILAVVVISAVVGLVVYFKRRGRNKKPSANQERELEQIQSTSQV